MQSNNNIEIVRGRLFHKKYGKVMRDIANLSCSKEFMRANFGLHEYIDGRGNTQPMYYITKDGFMMLSLDSMAGMPIS
ncbi:MAG: Rha family transcriptional regulator [Bacteroidales bacterium]|nr:Rha family transcriptional regulator [Bacteroidales bacterium]